VADRVHRERVATAYRPSLRPSASVERRTARTLLHALGSNRTAVASRSRASLIVALVCRHSRRRRSCSPRWAARVCRSCSSGLIASGSPGIASPRLAVYPSSERCASRCGRSLACRCSRPATPGSADCPEFRTLRADDGALPPGRSDPARTLPRGRVAQLDRTSRLSVAARARSWVSADAVSILRRVRSATDTDSLA
jgi:hypothetical protein